MMGNFNSDSQEVTLFIGDKQIDNFKTPINVAEVFSTEDERLEELKELLQRQKAIEARYNRRQRHKKLVKQQMHTKLVTRDYYKDHHPIKPRRRKLTYNRVYDKQSKAEVKNFMQLLYQDPIDHIEITVTSA